MVVLPAPFGPSRPSTVPSCDVEVDPVERPHLPVGLDQPFDAHGRDGRAFHGTVRRAGAGARGRLARGCLLGGHG